MIKLIASDVDGTLLGKEKNISEANINAIKKALNQGIRFTIASGRGYGDIYPLIENTGLNCQILAGNGSQYFNEEGKLLTTCYLDKELCIEACKLFDEHGLHYFVHTSKDTVTTFPKEEVIDVFVKRKLNSDGGIYEEVYQDMTAHYAPFQHFVQTDDLDAFFTPDIDILKIEGIAANAKPITAIKPYVQQIKGISYLSSFDNNIEVTNVDAQKGKILLKACKKMGIDPSEVLVIGDGENDITMFELFENSVAVGNSVEIIKSLAKYHVASVDNDGVAEAIEKYALR